MIHENLVYPIRSDDGLTLETSAFQFLYGGQFTLPNFRVSMLCPRGGGGARDRVGTLNVRAHPTWGILANFEHKCWPRGREV